MFTLFFKNTFAQKTYKSILKLEKIILDSLEFDEVIHKVVDSILTELGYLHLGYRIIVLILVDKDHTTLKRISLSQTDEAKRLLATTTIPFPEMNIPLSVKENLCAKCFNENKSQATTDWKELLVPPFTKEEAVRYQQLVGIQSSMVYPVSVKGQPIGVLIFSLVKPIEKVTDEEKELIKSYTDIVGLAVQNAKLYTDLKEKKEEINKAKEQLENANKQLQELDNLKDEFVSLASHELRTPMTAIRGSLSTILEGYAGEISVTAREFLTAAYNENDRLIRLVNNLLNISRIESGRFKFVYTPVNMNAILLEVTNNLQSAAKEKGIFMEYKPNTSVPTISADEDKIKEVLINLIGNAIKFTHKGGVSVGLEYKDGMVITSISDTGSGIAPEDKDLLFKKFSQVQGNYAKQTGGTGLGLYICKIIIEGLKGKIWLDSTVGRGSTFYFSLPIVS